MSHAVSLVHSAQDFDALMLKHTAAHQAPWRVRQTVDGIPRYPAVVVTQVDYDAGASVATLRHVIVPADTVRALLAPLPEASGPDAPDAPDAPTGPNVDAESEIVTDPLDETETAGDAPVITVDAPEAPAAAETPAADTPKAKRGRKSHA